MVSLSDENAMPVMSVCELCGMNFPSAAQLETHRARFCQGSGLHREVLARRNMERNAIAGNLQEDEITAISRGLAGLSDDAFGMTVSQLRDKVTREAAERTEQRLKAERAAEHAAVAPLTFLLPEEEEAFYAEAINPHPHPHPHPHPTLNPVLHHNV